MTELFADEELLDDVIIDQIETLKQLDIINDGKSYNTVLNQIDKTEKILKSARENRLKFNGDAQQKELEEAKLSLEKAKIDQQKELEEAKTSLDNKNRMVDRIINISLAVGSGIGTSLLYLWFMKKGFKFEENGTYTSTTFREMIKDFKPKKF